MDRYTDYLQRLAALLSTLVKMITKKEDPLYNRECVDGQQTAIVDLVERLKEFGSPKQLAGLADVLFNFSLLIDKKAETDSVCPESFDSVADLLLGLASDVDSVSKGSNVAKRKVRMVEVDCLALEQRLEPKFEVPRRSNRIVVPKFDNSVRVVRQLHVIDFGGKKELVDIGL